MTPTPVATAVQRAGVGDVHSTHPRAYMYEVLAGLSASTAVRPVRGKDASLTPPASTIHLALDER
jgi:hypothetical protein